MAAEQNNEAERAALLPCAFCGSAGKVTNGTVKCTGLSCGAEIWTLHDEASIERWNRRPSSSIGEDGRAGDLSMLVRQLVHSLKKAKPDSDLAARAVDYLKRKGLAGSPLRAAGEAKPVEFDGIKTPEFEGIGEGGLLQAAQGVKTELLQEIQAALDLLADTKMTTSTYVNVTNVLHHCRDAITGLGYYGAAPPLSSEQPADRVISLLREARATLEMWKDVAPAVSLCADIDKVLPGE
jgi:hypothetical protein